MLELKNIVKEYHVADETIVALNDVSITFRQNEFVSILGPSGCGKTTLLNIVGGLDRYTSGDLVINSRSTKEYKDRDWDVYRNHSIGFIFQSYNLIPHQTVLENVELALTLAGVTKEARHKRAIEVLKQVGLEDKIHNRPNQLSGGQMQRVAIARALINDPDILLADEPTGALDTKTSVQILELLKNIAKDRLIIMVTHNPVLAENYSTRIIKLLDGKVTDDTNPLSEADVLLEKAIVEKMNPEPIEEELPINDDPKDKKKKKKNKKKKEKTSMSFFTALSLSFRNMLTKKGRTLMVAFAGSIGIIGIALILSVSYGFQKYIDRVEEDTLSSYPVTIAKETRDLSSLMTAMMGSVSSDSNHPLDRIYSNSVLAKMLKSLTSEVHTNNMTAFKAFIESKQDIIDLYALDVKYTYGITPYIFSADTSKIVMVNPSNLFDNMSSAMTGQESSGVLTQTMMSTGMNFFAEMVDNPELLETQYDVLKGSWPQSPNEMVLLVNDKNELSDYVLYALNIEDQDLMRELIKDVLSGKEVSTETKEYTYDYILSLKYKMLSIGDLYQENSNGSWEYMQKNETFMKRAIDNNGMELSISGIVRLKEGITAGSLTSPLNYQHALIEELVEHNNATLIVKEQLKYPEMDIFTGKAFETPEITIEMANQLFLAFLQTVAEEQRPLYEQLFNSLTDEEKIEYLRGQLGTEATYEQNIKKLEYIELDNPDGIYLYPIDFAAKDQLTDLISEYNNLAVSEGREMDVINYTDYIGLFLSSVTLILNIITYVLIAFVSISLIVSSIMIGVITYISVLERTKEIGILRSIGASKRDVSRVFNAETLIIGFVAGVIGILMTLILIIPINLIIESVGDIQNIARLPFVGAIVLIVISMVLTFIAGLFPAHIASKKDPVEALRTE